MTIPPTPSTIKLLFISMVECHLSADASTAASLMDSCEDNNDALKVKKWYDDLFPAWYSV